MYGNYECLHCRRVYPEVAAIRQALGDKLRLPTAEGSVKLTIVGLLPARTLPGNEEVFVTLLEAQKLLDLPNRINTIEANFDTTDSARREAIQSAIQDELGKDYHLGALSSGSELIASIQTGQAAFNLMGFLALFMGGFIIFNTFRTIVAERRHDIGMLRAIGASRSTIIALFLSEGILQGVIGTAVGMSLGYLMGASLVVLGSPLYAQFLHLQLGAPVIAPSLIALTVSLGVGVTLVAGLLPARLDRRPHRLHEPATPRALRAEGQLPPDHRVPQRPPQRPRPVPELRLVPPLPQPPQRPQPPGRYVSVGTPAA